MSLTDSVYADPEGRYAIQRPLDSDRSLRLWTVERLRFHTSQPPWQKELVRRLVDEMRVLQLERAEVLRGVFVSDDRQRVDAENALFYNLHGRSFAGAPPCVRFERSWAAAKPPPVALCAPARYQHVYEGVRAPDGFRSWELLPDALASWTDVECSRIAGERAGWHIWRAMRDALPTINVDPLTAATADFGVSVSARVPERTRVSAVGAIKGVVDGVIASFQRFPSGAQRPLEVADLLASTLHDASADALLAFLTEPAGALFAEPPFNARGRLALNPCDDRCVAGELVIEVDRELKAPVLSGRLASVRPARTPDASTVTPTLPPQRRLI